MSFPSRTVKMFIVYVCDKRGMCETFDWVWKVQGTSDNSLFIIADLISRSCFPRSATKRECVYLSTCCATATRLMALIKEFLPFELFSVISERYLARLLSFDIKFTLEEKRS